MIIVNKLLASNIKRVRLTNRLSQRSMAALIGTNQSVISSWERKVKEPDRKFIEKISDVFRIPVEALYCDDVYSYIWEIKVKETEAICSDSVEKSNEKEEQKKQEEPKTTPNNTNNDINNRMAIDISNLPKETKNTILKMIDAATPIPYGETVLRFVNEFLLQKAMFDSDIVIVNKIREVLLEKTYSTVIVSIVDLRNIEKKAKSFQIITNNNISKNIYSIEERLAEYNCNSDFFHISYDLKKSKADRYFLNIILLVC